MVELVISKKVNETENPHSEQTELKCGIIMPIAAMNDYSEGHWHDVKSIIMEATQQVEGFIFKTEIVSNSDGEINIIHKNIISNIYNSHIVVCDISGRNPNVLFELGMRLTFDKPTIIIKGDDTPYIFDTSSIETLTYPRDLRFGSIVNFKKELANRIKLTYQKSIDDSSYSPFLGNFGEYKVPALKQTAMTTVEQLLLDEMTNIKSEFRSIRKDYIRKTDPVVREDNRHNEISFFVNLMTNYFKETNDNRPPEKILISNEFYDYLFSKNIRFDLKAIPKSIQINIAKDIQNDKDLL